VKVFYQVFLVGPHTNYRLEYGLAGQPAACCPGMAREWGKLVGFGAPGSVRSPYPTIYLYTTHLFSTGTPVGGITPIAYCCWCGRRIKLREQPDTPELPDLPGEF
jgi:hypothetical protein